MNKEYFTNVTLHRGKILYTGYSSGKRITTKIDPVKNHFYVRTQEESEFKNIYSEPLKRVEFDSISGMRTFVKEMGSNLNIHGYAPHRQHYAFIADQFKEPLHVGIEDIKVGVVDIETTVTGSIDTVNVPEEIVLITYTDYVSKIPVTFGTRSSTNKNFIMCSDEKDLLIRFIEHVRYQDPDILSGWNVNGFDVPYVIGRTNKLLSEKVSSRLSPFGVIELKMEKFKNKEIPTYVIAGRSIIDLLVFYKKFVLTKREKYSLDFISQLELGVGKLENPYNSFNEWMENDWNQFVEYNQIDCLRVIEIDQKLRLISLALGISYLTGVNYIDVLSPVRTWECYILGTLLKENVFCSIRRPESDGSSIVGAYVSKPTPGFYDWIVSVDGKSLYPSIIIGLNMSPETFVGMEYGVSVEGFLSGKLDFSGHNYCVAANGAKFSMDKVGVLPRLTANVLDGRDIAKKAMIAAKKRKEEIHSEMVKFESPPEHLLTEYSDQDKIASIQNVFQQAWKVLANSLFGAAGNPGFIFFDNRIAEGITMTGQYVIRYVGNYCDEKFNKFFSTDSYKYNIYQDTDSCYFTFGNVVNKYYSGKTDLQITSALDRLMEQKLRTFINESTDIISARQNYYKSTMFFKRETISSSGFWMAPKKYALKIYDSEGVIYQNGDYKIMGIEVVRSSTPEMVREDLRTCVQRIIDRDEGGVHKLIQNVHNQFMVEDIDRISSPRSASDVVGYSSDESVVTDSAYLEDFSGGVAYKSRTPIHVRGAILYNEFIKKNDLTYKYPLLDDGDKLKFTYLKMPNPIKENVIAYVDKLPEEMGLEKYVDREMQFEKTFMGPVIKMFEAVGWKLDNEENPLEALFG